MNYRKVFHRRAVPGGRQIDCGKKYKNRVEEKMYGGRSIREEGRTLIREDPPVAIQAVQLPVAAATMGYGEPTTATPATTAPTTASVATRPRPRPTMDPPRPPLTELEIITLRNDVTHMRNDVNIIRNALIKEVLPVKRYVLNKICKPEVGIRYGNLQFYTPQECNAMDGIYRPANPKYKLPYSIDGQSYGVCIKKDSNVSISDECGRYLYLGERVALQNFLTSGYVNRERLAATQAAQPVEGAMIQTAEAAVAAGSATASAQPVGGAHGDTGGGGTGGGGTGGGTGGGRGGGTGGGTGGGDTRRREQKAY